ncbi:MAG TPA: hypothetical protein VFK11_02530 [Candidatus Saccharimonadales bacterium]|nr:hypothetical protein [Candidatus Saccharimonadales bacterium]
MKPGVSVEIRMQAVESVEIKPTEVGGLFVAKSDKGFNIASETLTLQGKKVRRGIHIEGRSGNMYNHHDLGARAIDDCISTDDPDLGLYELAEGASLTFHGYEGESETIEGPAQFRELRIQPAATVASRN